ncbi:MAG TPA: HipA family kinase [Solirubrobacteraceae bacterium]
MRTVNATRYVVPLREGGSLPALVEADDDGMYVVKLRGAGQGPRALASELLAGEIARTLGLPVPELVLVTLDPRIAVAEPDPEIQDLLRASEGLNVGMDFLPGALAYNPLEPLAAELAADVVWFDALVLNVDRTPRNPNLLRWHRDLWLIDHGAAFFRHHSSAQPGWDAAAAAVEPFGMIAEHVLLSDSGPAAAADERLAALLSDDVLERLVKLVPPEWADPAAYLDFLRARLAAPRSFVQEIEQARGRLAAPRFFVQEIEQARDAQR